MSSGHLNSTSSGYLRRLVVLEQEVVDVYDIRIEHPSAPDNTYLGRIHVYFTDGSQYVNTIPNNQTRRELINSLREMATEIEKLETPYLYR